MSDRKQATIEVPTKGGEPKEDKEPQLPPGPNPELKDLDKEKAKDAEMSAEDAALKERLELAVERATQEREPGLQTAALELLRSEIKGATSSMTSVPKPFKFLSPHFKTLRAAFEGPAPSKSPASGTAASSASAAAPLSPNAVPSGAKFVDPAVRRLAADILSVLAMTMGEEGKRDCLRFKFLGNTGDASASASVEQREKAEEEAIGSWGGEYVRHLSGELGQEYQHRQEKEGDNADYADLLAMIKIVVRYNLKHNAEVEAVDLLLETEQLDLLLVPNAVDESSHGRVCLYLLRCSDYAADVSEAEHTQQIAFSLYLSHKQFTQALVVALRMGGPTLKDRIDQVFTACEDRATRKQMGHLLGRHRAMSYIAKDDAVDAAIGNQSLSSLFANLAKDLDVVEAKSPEDVYKQHLVGASERGSSSSTATSTGVESAKNNLASTYVNAWVNAGFGSDKLVSPADSQWVFRNKDSGQMAAAASLGMINAWDESRLDALDKYLNAEEENVRGGAVLGLALMACGTRNLDVDPMLALLGMHLEEGSGAGQNMKIGALYGLGLVYAGSAREDVAELLTPYIAAASSSSSSSSSSAAAGAGGAGAAGGLGSLDLSALGAAPGTVGASNSPLQPTPSNAVFDCACMAALALGMVFVGTAKEDAASTIADRLMSATSNEQNSAIARHMALGLGLLFLGQGEACEAMLEILTVVEEAAPALAKLSKTLLKSCAYAGTGNVLCIQELLQVCAAHPEIEDKEKDQKAKEEADRKVAADAVAAGPRGAAGGAGAGAGAGGAGGAAAAAAAAAAASASSSSSDASADNKHGANAAGRYLDQSTAVLGLALVSLGEDLSVDMATRMADHLLQYGDTSVRRMVPIALGLLHASEPDYAIVDTLSKLSHDPNLETAQAAIFSMGIVSAGTNNSRVAGLLRTLSVFYKDDPNVLFVIRLAQGLTHMGKGLIGLNPIHADRNLLSPVALAGLLSTLLLFLDVKSSLHGTSKWHILLYSLAMTMHPRFVTTISEDLADAKPMPVEVRVGTAVDTVGQAGRPKTITGFQTHSTPVLIGTKDRAELVDEAFYPLTPIIEGIVILRKNPHYKPQKGKGTMAGAIAGGAGAGGAGGTNK